MARDERKDGGKKDADASEDYEFVPPDFDEDAFIHREMVSFRTTTILFLWGIVAALLSWALFAAVDGERIGWLIGLGVAAVFGFALKWLYPRLGADVKHFKRREWLGTGFLFFFTWLAFFILAVNPPVSDFAAPRVDVHASPAIQQSGGDVAIEAFFEDNDRVAAHELAMTGPDGPVALADDDLGRGRHRYTATGLAPGIYEVTATATDRKGHTQQANLTVRVVEAVLDVDVPDGGRLDDARDSILVNVGGGLPACTKKLREDCIRTVRLELAGGGTVVAEVDPKNENRWVVTADHAGWRQGQVAFTAVAEVVDDYAGSVRLEGGTLRDGPHSVNVTAALGDYEPKVVSDPPAPRREVPGLGVPVLAALVLGVAFLLRRR